MTPERRRRIRQVLDRRQPDLTVIADAVHKGRNLAAIQRTCDAVGIDTIHCVRPEAGYSPYRGTSLGAQKWVTVMLYDRVEEPISRCKAEGYQLVATSLGADSRDFRKIDYTRPTALVLGSERDGVSERTLQAADAEIHIPMVGMVDSYNVSVACAIILSEAYRQRELAGLYDRPRLTATQYSQRFFEWAHPTIARFCRERDLPYPAVGEDGEVVQPASWYRELRRKREEGRQTTTSELGQGEDIATTGRKNSGI